MIGTLPDRVGFAHPNRRTSLPRRYALSLELMATVALVVSTIVAATVVSIGIARADGLGLGPAAAADRSFSAGVLLGLILIGWGGLTALMARNAAPAD